MEEYSREERLRVWLRGLPGVGNRKFQKLMEFYGSAEEVWSDPSSIEGVRDEAALDAFFSRLAEEHIRILTRVSPDFPPQLQEIADAPEVLFLRGELPRRCFTVVGTRRATLDGRRAAREFSHAIAQAGVAVVSGMAAGIDQCAHEGALAAGKSVAVLGAGVDLPGSMESRELCEQILESGGALLSEYYPGTPPLPGNFPARNRILSALSPGILVVEAGEVSGALITAEYAFEQRRDVFAIPGSIYSPSSVGANRLIAEGAYPALTPGAIPEFYGWSGPPAAVKPTADLTEDEQRIVEFLLLEPLSMDELVEKTNFPVSKLNSCLTSLELRGIIVKAPGGIYRAYQ